MKENTVLMISFAVALTANLTLATWTHDVQLVTDPGGLDISAPVGEPFNISCEGEGGDNGKYAFMKWWNPGDNAIEEQGTPGVVRNEKNILILTFTNPKIEDSGIYRCTATYDDEQNLEYLVNIHFHGPEPEFYIAFENVTAEEGTKLEVNCSAEVGEKPITYTWYNQNEDMISEDTSKPIFVSNRPNFSTLIIREVKNDQAGMYTCTANNTHGLTSKVYALNVFPPSDNDTDASGVDVKVVNISATSVKFYISSKKIVWNFEVKYTEIRENNESRALLTPVSDNIYTISKLIPGGLYSFQFRNPQSGSWSKVYRVTLLPGVPEIIFQNLESNSIKIEWSRMMDDILRSTIDKHELKYYTVGMEGGNKWIPSSCAVTIEIPSCFVPRYTISGLWQKVYYQIEVRAHTESGYGEPARQKIYLSG